MNPEKELEIKIIALLKEYPALRKSSIRKKLKCKCNSSFDIFKIAFKNLLKTGKINKLGRGEYGLKLDSEPLTGIIKVNPKGFGFIIQDTPDQPDVFIPPRYINNAISSDQVLFKITANSDDRGPVGEVIKIIQRSKKPITGQLFIDKNNAYHIKPLRKEMPESIPITQYKTPQLQQLIEEKKIKTGNWITAEINSAIGKKVIATLTGYLKNSNYISADLDAIINEYELAKPYTKTENKLAETLEPVEIEREDIQNLTILTIDPTDAKDFDDAISIQPSKYQNSYRIGIHIADVACYVTAGSQLDNLARKRLFTSYLPGRTLPMLPPTLAATTCSLIEQQPRNAHSVYLDINKKTGKIEEYHRCHSKLKIYQRLTFQQVQNFIETEQNENFKPKTQKTLQKLINIAKVMRQRRQRNEQFLEMTIPELKMLCTENPPAILSLDIKKTTQANQLVEEFMLAANSAVAAELHQKEIPGLYRTHAQPADDDLKDFTVWANKNLELPIKEIETRSDINQFLHSVSTLPQYSIISLALLTTMQRAIYRTKPAIHYGLGKELYSHFTSPIRRYTDLLIHQQLLAHDLKQKPYPIKIVQEIAQICTQAEENNDSAYFAAMDRMKIHYLRNMLENNTSQITFKGIISKLTNDEIIIYIPSLGLYGSCSLQQFHKEKTKKSYKLYSNKSNQEYNCGSEITIKIKDADLLKGRIHLQPIDL